ncbi:MAG: YeeE/YedE family protein, partial [Undibacterium sp.]|nr:YeeE/YedE family protein [Undibacterium sp.]
IVGALIFGIGWGISGYCPGPAIASLASPNWETWIFLPAMLAGILLQRLLAGSRNKQAADA